MQCAVLARALSLWDLKREGTTTHMKTRLNSLIFLLKEMSLLMAEILVCLLVFRSVYNLLPR